MKTRKTYQKAALLLSLALLAVAVVGGTVALLTVGTDSVTNTFDVGSVACRVNYDYTITNIAGTVSSDGTLVDAYIRAAVAVNWVDNYGNLYGSAPSYTITPGTGWVLAEDGFYYYTSPVAPEDNTSKVCTVNNTPGLGPSGYALTVQIVAEAIQAAGVNGSDEAAVLEAWSTGISAVSDTGVLTVKAQGGGGS